MFYDVFSYLCDLNGKRAADVSRDLGINKSTISMWKKQKSTPNTATIMQLSEYFNVAPNFFVGGDVEDLGNEKSPAESGRAKKKGVKIPVLGRVAAGIPIEAIEDIIDYEEIAEEMARKGEYIGLQIVGDSMEPQFVEGDVVIVRQQPTVENGQIAIIIINGADATCKKVIYRSNGMSLISTNSAYPPMFFNDEQIQELPVTIIGRVVELRRKF